MKKELLINILLLVLALVFIVIVFSLSQKRDVADGVRWDDCITEYEAQGMPPSTYEAFMKPCMDGE